MCWGGDVGSTRNSIIRDSRWSKGIGDTNVPSFQCQFIHRHWDDFGQRRVWNSPWQRILAGRPYRPSGLGLYVVDSPGVLSWAGFTRREDRRQLLVESEGRTPQYSGRRQYTGNHGGSRLISGVKIDCQELWSKAFWNGHDGGWWTRQRSGFSRWSWKRGWKEAWSADLHKGGGRLFQRRRLLNRTKNWLHLC